MPLSWGVKSIVSVPFYNGSHRSNQETVLTVAIIGYSEVDPYETGKLTRSEKSNRLLLSLDEPFIEKRYVPIYDLNANIKLLQDLYEDAKFYSMNLCLAPFGSKVQALATSILIQKISRETAKIHVLNARPFYYTHEYPKPPLDTWEYSLF
jgi:hypothetical protein